MLNVDRSVDEFRATMTAKIRTKMAPMAAHTQVDRASARSIRQIEICELSPIAKYDLALIAANEADDLELV